jgi:steroid delta-isomerase-like uncharacterized protein
MISTDTIALAARGITAFNTADWDTMRDVCQEDVVYTETGTGRRLEGIEACLDAWREWREAMPDVTGTIGRSLAEDDVVVMELTWRGTHDGPLMSPQGALPATGKTVTVMATQWQTHRDGRIATIDHHLDILALLAQIGAMDA